MGSHLWVIAQASSIALLPLNIQFPYPPPLLSSRSSLAKKGGNLSDGAPVRRERIGRNVIASINAAGAPLWDRWKPEKSAPAPSLSDVLWPAAGAFAAMAVFGKIDQILAWKGLSMTIAPLGAVTAVLFTTPSSPAARKYNMFMAQVGCAAFGVLAFTIFGPCWLARASALSASIAFMLYTGSIHPPAASLPILFIDGAKLHHLNYCKRLCLTSRTISNFSR
ncbi:hypothetical protein SAY86_011816 [Trapa natans]|uniref:HPP transmembrane region domain-containing protein n=1 Tax=Trapa natans TaxID=22666 RepID=A0AAN7M905_TRANT|nr:hypothetical protein SAY86_011816 [Trapa natans]